MTQHGSERSKRSQDGDGSFVLFIRAVATTFFMLPGIFLARVYILSSYFLPSVPFVFFLTSRGYIESYWYPYGLVYFFVGVSFVTAIISGGQQIRDLYKSGDSRKSIWPYTRERIGEVWQLFREDFWAKPGEPFGYGTDMGVSEYVERVLAGFLLGLFVIPSVVVLGKPVSTYSDLNWLFVICSPLFFMMILMILARRERNRELLRLQRWYQSHPLGAKPKGIEPLEISWWEKMPLLDKCLLATVVVVVPVWFWYLHLIFTRFSVRGYVAEEKRAELVTVMAYFLAWLSGFYSLWRSDRALCRIIDQDETLRGVILASRAEYLDGHPLLVEPQTVYLFLLPTELVIEACLERVVIPVENIWEVRTKEHEVPAWASLVLPRALGGLATKSDNLLVVEYQEKGMLARPEVRFGYIVPPHTHAEWKAEIYRAQYELGKPG